MYVWMCLHVCVEVFACVCGCVCMYVGKCLHVCVEVLAGLCKFTSLVKCAFVEVSLEVFVTLCGCLCACHCCSMRVNKKSNKTAMNFNFFISTRNSGSCQLCGVRQLD